MTEEWGPWIEHDGQGCPCVGMVVHVVCRSGEQKVVIAGEQCAKAGVSVNGIESAWVYSPHSIFSRHEIIRYRIRKPKGLTILEGLLEDLPERVDA
jgi:hypothetical protein